MRIFFAVALVVGLALGCGSSGDAPDEPAMTTSHEALCAGDAVHYADGTTTMASCAFVQHADNIVTYGSKLENEVVVHDASGASVATVTHTCDVWAIGVDAANITVLIDRSTGRIVSHGDMHPGNPKTALASPRALPFDLR
jgi:hypothetical protein